MFSLLTKFRRGRPKSPREVARQRLESAIRQDRLEVSAPQLSVLRDSLLSTISEHLPVASEFTEFTLQRDGEDVFLVSRVRLASRR